MMRRTRKSGATALEFALIAPVFFAMIFGMIDVGWMFFVQAAMDSSIHMGCRQASMVDPGINEIDLHKVYQKGKSSVLLSMDQLGLNCNTTCKVTLTAFGTNPGRGVQCVVERPYTPLIGLTFGTVMLRSQTAIRLEWQR